LIEVREYGEGDSTVVVLHGGPGAPGSAASLARELASGFRVLEPLQRRRGTEALTVERHCDDLAVVAPDRAALVGWSWGAMLALSYASRYPARASAVALIGCGTYDTSSRAIYQRALDERLGLDGRSAVDDLQRRIASETDRSRRDRLFSEMAGIITRVQSFLPITVREDSAQVDSLGHEETWRDVLRLQQEGVEPARFSAITAPVLMLHGDDDPHAGAATRDLLRRYIPHLEYISFARCGHTPWLEKYSRNTFLKTLQNWLANRPSDGPCSS
jgi:pimeloyl-ACP methyl ester carboxylesterase